MALRLGAHFPPPDVTVFHAVRRQIAGELIAEILSRRTDTTLVTRDLAASSPGHVDEEFAADNLRLAQDGGDGAYSDPLIEELIAARSIVISTPMYNFAVPSTLKAWIDRVVRPGLTFKSSPDGKMGLLRDRPVYIVASCGGRIGDGPRDQRDFLSPYLRYVLGVVGLTHINVLMMDGMLRGTDVADSSLAAARNKMRSWFSDNETISAVGPDAPY